MGVVGGNCDGVTDGDGSPSQQSARVLLKMLPQCAHAV